VRHDPPSRLTPQDFGKYEEVGAYHWRSVTGAWWRRSPVDVARYRVVARLLQRRVARLGLGLDLGCGDGVMLHELRRVGLEAVGIEADSTGIGLARECHQRAGVADIRLISGSVYELPIRSGAVSFCCSVEVVEHLDDAAAFVAEAARVLQPDAPLVLTTPRRRSDELRDPYHVYEYEASEVEDLLRRHFRHVDVRGQFFNPLLSLYTAGTGVRAVDKALRGGTKAAAALGANVFGLRPIRVLPSQWFDGIISVSSN
jgi:SAM-dependent methyltransferase